MTAAAPPTGPAREELERAVRLLAVRARREVSSAFAGGYRSAFRGGGVEFEESRPYAPGDDVRSLDWNAMARTGEPWVKRFREERDQTVLLALDVSASMGFGTRGRSKATVAAHAAALLAAAASRAGDRVGLLAFSDGARAEIPPGRGEAQLGRVLRSLVETAAEPGGATGLSAAVARARHLARRRAVVVLLSDFRDPHFFEDRAGLLALARNHDVVAGVVQDPVEEALPDAGSLRVGDAERGGGLVLRSGSRRARERYAAAAAVRRRALERRLRGDGADVLWLHTHRDPLTALARFFRRHPGVHRGATA